MKDRPQYDQDSTVRPSSILRRHLSTIGIDDVFLEPPADQTLPKFYLGAFANKPLHMTPCEIVGRIKSAPEDFIVREISLHKPHDNCTEYPRVADLSDISFREDSQAACHKASEGDHIVEKLQVNKEEQVSKEEQGRVKEKEEQNEEGVNGNNDGISKISTTSPLGTVTQILQTSQWTDGFTADGIFASIEALQKTGASRIKERLQDSIESDVVWIPPFSQCTTEANRLPGGGIRGQFHRALKVVFPFVCTETVKREDESLHSDESQNASGTQTLWIKVSLDDTFFGLVPFLCQPEVDMLELYRFRNCGFSIPETNEIEGNRNERGTKRQRGSSEGACTNDKGSHAVLHLRQNLPRGDRRHIHQIIAKGCKDFETSTNPNAQFPIMRESGSSTNNVQQDTCEKATPSTSSTTAAVIVKWSKQAQRIALRKRNQRTKAPPAGSREERSSNILCVVKKRKKEHLTAIQHLTIGIRCRQSDIGLAGIKDMQAITYQFCTIKNSTIQRVRAGNNYLKHHGIELGSYRVVNWTLDQGSLHGNKFELVIRDISRVKALRGKESQRVEEEFIPCEQQYAEQAVERIRRSGFINYYGEQRLGVAGQSSEVGVRSFDIGRAMLQQNFGKAIDLLIEGRLRCSGNYTEESPEIRNARKIWKESGGDAATTLKALPRGESMARERTVLKGLKRYGNDDPLSALKCLHFGVRQFYINAFQSLVWNKVASERMKRFGVKVVPGDLYVSKHGCKKEIHVVEDNATNIDLSQVVLPLPGYNVRYPVNEIGQIYDAIMREESIIFKKDAPPEVTAKGSYRQLIAFAENIDAEFTTGKGSCVQNESNIEEGSQVPEDDIVKSIKLTFDLRSGSYATMMLRELMFTTVTRDNLEQ